MIDFDEMRVALDRGEFYLEYLPIVTLVDGRCIGAEALSRWQRTHDVVQPIDFILKMENTPLSGALTYWVIDTVAVELKEWLRSHPDAHVSINIPPEIAGRGGVLYVGQKSGLAEFGSQVILELTERGLPDSLGLQAMDRAHTHGVKLALDDVNLVRGGSLAILARCAFDIIKLDRALIAQITADDPRPAWLDGIAALLVSSDLMVIAEGVETEVQLAALRAAGVQAAQGFHFSKPLPAEALFAFHREAGRAADAAEMSAARGAGDGRPSS